MHNMFQSIRPCERPLEGIVEGLNAAKAHRGEQRSLEIVGALVGAYLFYLVAERPSHQLARHVKILLTPKPTVALTQKVQPETSGLPSSGTLAIAVDDTISVGEKATV